MKKYIKASEGHRTNLSRADAQDFDDVIDDLQVMYNVADRIKWAIEQMQAQVDNDDDDEKLNWADFLETAFSDLNDASSILEHETEAVYETLVLNKR